LATFCWTKSLLCNDAFIQGSCFFQSLHFRLVLQEESVQISRQLNSVPLQPSGRRDILFGCSTVQASSVRKTRTFRSDLPLCQEVSSCSSLHPSRRLSSTSDAILCSIIYGFLSKTQIWEDSCNRPDDVDSCPDALIHKASRAFKIQTSGR